jgi:hypothetical protein
MAHRCADRVSISCPLSWRVSDAGLARTRLHQRPRTASESGDRLRAPVAREPTDDDRRRRGSQRANGGSPAAADGQRPQSRPVSGVLPGSRSGATKRSIMIGRRPCFELPHPPAVMHDRSWAFSTSGDANAVRPGRGLPRRRPWRWLLKQTKPRASPDRATVGRDR